MVTIADAERNTEDVHAFLGLQKEMGLGADLYNSISASQVQCILVAVRQLQRLEARDANALLERLMEHATQRQFVYTHRWRVNDLVMWDNKCTLHRGRPFDDTRWPRDAQRATSQDIGPTCEQEGIPIPQAAE